MGSRRCECEYYIRLCTNQLGCHRIQSPSAEASAIDLKISALNKAPGSEFFKKRLLPAYTRILQKSIIRQISNAAAPPGFLRPSNRKRRDCGRRADQFDELATFHVGL